MQKIHKRFFFCFSEPSKDDGKATPMQKIKENRSKWRENQKKNLEESWGSLTMFDRQQKGRISMDLDGNKRIILSLKI